MNSPMKSNILDLSQFQWIESQTSESDRCALLSIREAICSLRPSYRYFEIGSHLGGSIQPHVVDVRCTGIFSIDPRPAEQPDERWRETYKYEGNSTERMLEGLRKIPGSDIGKVRCFDCASWDLPTGAIEGEVHFAFIDGEHTNAAVLRDYASTARFLAQPSVLAFHDSFATASALLDIRDELQAKRAGSEFVFFPGSAVVAIVQHPHELVPKLQKFGWEARLPFTRFDAFRYAAKVRFPKVFTALRQLRDLAKPTA